MAPDLRPRVSSRRSWLAAGVVVAVALVRLLGLDLVSPTILAVAYHPYLVALCVPLLLVPWRAGQVRQLGVAFLALLLAAAPLLPRQLGGEQALADDATPLRVATLNMFFGSADADQVVALATQVEVLALVEVTQEGITRLTEAGLAQVMPYRTVDLRPDAGGTGIWSRYPLVAGDVLDSVYAMPSAAVTVPGVAEPVSVRAVHPVPPTGGDARTWAEELDAIATAPPVDVLLGDFNATLDHRALRRLIGSGYVDVADALGKGFATTWPTMGVPLPGITIDHVLVGGRAQPLSLEVRDVDGTDHRALVADLGISP